MKRCNYCGAPATVWFYYIGHVYAIRRRRIKCVVTACAEHEGCVNWNGIRALHPDSPLERIKP